MPNHTPESLALTFDSDALNARAAAAEARITERQTRAAADGRELTTREVQLTADDRAELQALDQAAHYVRRAAEFDAPDPAALAAALLARDAGASDAELRERFAGRVDFSRGGPMMPVPSAGSRPLPSDGRPTVAGALQEFAAIVRERRIGIVRVPETYTAELAGQQFAVSTTNAGAQHGVGSTPAPVSPYFTDLAGIPLEPPTGSQVSGPVWPALAAQAAPAEGGTVPTLADPTLGTAPMGFYSRQSTLSEAVVRFGQGQGNTGNRLRAEVINDVNSAFLTTALAAAGTALTFATSATFMVDKGIAHVQALAGQRPGLIAVNEADYPSVSARSATSGSGIGEPVLAYNGVPLVIHNTVTAGFALVIAGNGWTAYRDTLELASAVLLGTGQIGYRASQFAGARQEFAGASCLVDLIA